MAPRKLELGCGRNPTPGYLHHDLTHHAPHVEVVHDLEVTPWPWPHESMDEILALDVFEHLHLMPADWMAECHRILVPGGKLSVRVPVFGSPWHIMDPTHVRGFAPENFEYFVVGKDLHTRFGSFYFGFAFCRAVISIQDKYNIRADLWK